jgi:hypothetical protein
MHAAGVVKKTKAPARCDETSTATVGCDSSATQSKKLVAKPSIASRFGLARSSSLEQKSKGLVA